MENGSACANPCPECGGPMYLRDGAKGQFYGCERYPDCGGSLSLNYETIKFSEAPNITRPEIVRQLLCSLCLGAAIASKEFRAKLTAEDFYDANYEAAFKSLSNGNGVSGLSTLMEWEYGVTWKTLAGDGNPIDAAINRLKLTAKQSAAIHTLSEAIQDTIENTSDTGIEKFLETIRETSRKIDEQY